MKTKLRKTVLLPMLAALVMSPICTRAHADDFLGLGWWVVPIVIGGVAIYELGRYQADDSSQHAVYAPPEPSYVQPESGYVQPQKVYLQPTPVYSQQHWFDQPPTYYQQQYGYVIETSNP